MNSVIDKHWNGYKLIYNGDNTLYFLRYEINPRQEFYIYKDFLAELLNYLTPDEREYVVYDKVILSDERRAYHEVIGATTI